jgi:hypothetical protein
VVSLCVVLGVGWFLVVWVVSKLVTHVQCELTAQQGHSLLHEALGMMCRRDSEILL